VSTTDVPRGTTLNVHVTGRRVVSTIIDGLVLGGFFAIMASIFGTTTSSEPGTFSVTMSTGPTLVCTIAAIAYFILMEGYLGRTLGKMVTGIRIIDEQTGDVPGLGKATIRTVLRVVDGLLGYLVALIVVLVSAKRQRIGDMAAHTLVVRA
jgi:uncharacterized RDD family membrane protein YckC